MHTVTDSMIENSMVLGLRGLSDAAQPLRLQMGGFAQRSKLLYCQFNPSLIFFFFFSC